MSQKKPAARDISDLKARLGLKKQAPAKPAGGGHLVAPPGAARAAVPAPPGAQPPQPHIPDASTDPFGAMNAMAAHQAQTRGPEIIVVNDGAPVESVEKRGVVAKYGKFAAMIAVPLVLGIAVGQISSSAKRSNEVIDDAGTIHSDLKKLNNGLVSLNDILLDAKTRGPGGKAFKLNDEKLTADLDAFDFPKVDNADVYSSSMYELPVEVVENLLYYYQEMAQLREMVSDHVTKSKQDAKALAKGAERLGATLGNGMRFGALLEMPTADEAKAHMPPKVRVVELGAPVCEDGKPGQCQGPPTGVTVRADSKSINWSTEKFASAAGDNVSAKGVLLLDPTPVFTDAVMGAEATVAQVAYIKRITAIEEKVTALTDIGNKLASQLNAKAQESKKFTFFM